MHVNTTPAAIARRIKAAQDRAGQIEPITDAAPGFDLDLAYEAARLVHEARLAAGASAVGRKIGFSNSNIWPQYGVNAPIWGYVYDTTLIDAGSGHASCSLGRFAEPRIEPEIVLHLAQAPRAGSGPDELLACIDWIAHGFEIVQSHYPGWRFRAADTVADSALHGALVLGPKLAVADIGADPAAVLAAFTVTISRDGEAVDRGSGANVLGGPPAALAHLIDTLERSAPPSPLLAGELVTTGTLTGAWPVQPDERWSSRFEGIPLEGLHVSFNR